MIAGVIFCHLALTTPIIFKTLQEEDASRFLRAIFPRYYLLIFLLSLPALTLLNFQDSQLSWWLGFNLSAHALVGLIGIPITNAAKDRGWDKVFSFTHGVSVYCTVVIFALSIIQFFILITTYVVLDFLSLMGYALLAQKLIFWIKANPKTINTISASVLILIALIIIITQQY